ncbi:GlxA family transcriptional regulator [Planobispora siamensis]|uniref:GlxA family transcriptional regulator n=1 Tax=Planobispora siamensis TaxID=936338 RepID=UPI001950C38A|nr:helix-turn-helix domain-containing protein [Planobispora siamensis]
MIRDVVAVVGRQAAVFELGLVCQVFGLDRSEDGLPSYDFAVCAPRPGMVPTTSGFAIEVRHGLDRTRTADLVIVPAWGDEPPLPEGVAEALRAAVARGAMLLSVCTGAFALAEAGLLDGRRAATHWQFAPRLARRYPRVRVDPGALYVEDGPIVTSAGASAGIDACLHVVRREFGAATANALARRMVVPPHRSGDQAQYVEAPVPAAGEGYGLAELLDWMQAHLDRPLTVEALAARALMSPRTFARRFKDVTGTTPHRWLLDQRLRLAEQLLETTDLPVDAVAARTGLGSPDTLRHHFAARRGITPTDHRRAFRAD